MYRCVVEHVHVARLGVRTRGASLALAALMSSSSLLPALLGGLTLASVSPCAAAQEAVQRSFPLHALRGEMLVTTPPEVMLNGAPARLSPGARIRGTSNLIVQSAGLSGARLLVHYTRDNQAQINEVWVLRPDEAQRAWPRTAQEAAALVYDPSSRTWRQP
ncbi:MAG: hypothetical protein RIQ60_2467 [Pseudomonadota bacterium]|jgi:hypothetical protein